MTGPLFQLLHTAYLDQPAIAPLAKWPELQATVFRKMQSAGFEPGFRDMRVEGPSYQPQDLIVAFFAKGVAVRVRIDSVEIWTNDEEAGATAEIVVPAMDAALSALLELDPTLTAGKVVDDCWLHGDIPLACGDLLARYITSAPDASVVLLGAGLTFGATLPAGSSGERGLALVTLEPSLALLEQQTAFLRVRCEFHGAPQDHVHTVARSLFLEMASKFEIKRRG